MQLIRDGDVAPAIAAAQPGTGVDLLMGIGGTPEGVISAAALKCVGGGDPGQALAARRRGAAGSSSTPGYDLDRVLTTDDLVAGEDVFVAATGVTDGRAAPRRPLHGRRRASPTRSSCARARARSRRIEATHAFEQARALIGPRVPLSAEAFQRRQRARPRAPCSGAYDAGAGGAVHLRAVVERAPAPAVDVLRLVAAPGLQRRRLQRAAVRERQLPRVRARARSSRSGARSRPRPSGRRRGRRSPGTAAGTWR